MSPSTSAPAAAFRKARRPVPIRVANRLGRLLEPLGSVGASLGEASLLAAARRGTGLDHFADQSFRAPMRRLLAAIEQEARLHAVGRFMVRQSLLRVLRNRLRIEAEFDRHPEILEQPVEAPIFIAGLQRTGTTLLHRLLAIAPGLRALPAWEALNPAPARSRGRARNPDKERASRIRTAAIARRALRYLAPEFFVIHPVEVQAPEEDVLLLDLSFHSTTPEATMRVPSFSRWLASADHRMAYCEFKSTLQLLLWQTPGRWLGKTPHHLEFMDALLEVFPDARIIQTHRDPLRAIASFCSMVAHGRAVFSDEVDPHEVGRHWAPKAARMVERAMQTRERVGSHRFTDVPYEDLIADPITEVRRICEFLGMELTPEVERNMRDWVRANPQHKLGLHRYSLEDFGLDRDEEEQRFADYRRRFDIPHECR